MANLLPCPFCSGEPELLDLSGDFYVHCKDCEVQQIANYKAPTAERRWNMRKPVWSPIEAAPPGVDVCLIYDPETKTVGQGHRLWDSGEWIFQATQWRCSPTHWMPLPDGPR